MQPASRRRVVITDSVQTVPTPRRYHRWGRRDIWQYSGTFWCDGFKWRWWQKYRLVVVNVGAHWLYSEWHRVNIAFFTELWDEDVSKEIDWDE
jgi:hypothetical protein